MIDQSVPMTAEEVKQADFTLEAEWRQGLPVAFRTIAERHGKRHFILAHAIGSLTEALSFINGRAAGNQQVSNACLFIANSANLLAEGALRDGEMDRLKLAEIQRDIERAAQLAGASLVQNGKIIVAS